MYTEAQIAMVMVLRISIDFTGLDSGVYLIYKLSKCYCKP